MPTTPIPVANITYGLFIMTESGGGEHACAQSDVGDGIVTHNYVQARIINTLRYDKPELDWHQRTGTNHLHFQMEDRYCDQLSSTEMQDIELRYRVKTDANAQSTCYSYGYDDATECAIDLGPVYIGNHVDSRAYRIIHSRDSIYDNDGTEWKRRHMVSHETGHALGLMDPIYNTYTGRYEPCTDRSVMHTPYPYCPGNYAYRYPSDWDRDTVWELINKP
ncbi:hypothetical protein [Thermobaculum terrenum]|nr:hypothetical protein [Thermobaculum terrenum]